jgi:hypothetical protein
VAGDEGDDCEDDGDDGKDERETRDSGLKGGGEVERGVSNSDGDDWGGWRVNCQVLEATLSSSRMSRSGTSAPHSSDGNSSSSRLD